jgi:hypothetical protein
MASGLDEGSPPGSAVCDMDRSEVHTSFTFRVIDADRSRALLLVFARLVECPN